MCMCFCVFLKKSFWLLFTRHRRFFTPCSYDSSAKDLPQNAPRHAEVCLWGWIRPLPERGEFFPSISSFQFLRQIHTWSSKTSSCYFNSLFITFEITLMLRWPRFLALLLHFKKLFTSIDPMGFLSWEIFRCDTATLLYLRCMLVVLVFPWSTKRWHGLRDL